MLNGSSLEKERTKWFVRTLEAVLGAAIPAYFVIFFLHRELGIGSILEVPLIFASLIFAIELLLRQNSTVAELEQKVATMSQTVADLAAIAARLDRGAEVKFYQDRQFYEATRAAVESARSRVFVSYLRGHSPNRWDAARDHIEACRTWALQSPQHHFRRVILHVKGGRLGEFVASELEAVKKAASQDRRYVVRLLTDSVHQSEAISVGLYDHDLVFISYSGDSDHGFGFSIRSREIVEKYFEYYYDRLWSSAVPIEEFDFTHG